MASIANVRGFLISLLAVMVCSSSAIQVVADSLPAVVEAKNAVVGLTRSIEEAFTADLQQYLDSLNYTATNSVARTFLGRGRMLKLTAEQKACIGAVDEAGIIAGYPYLIPAGATCQSVTSSTVYHCSPLMFQLLNANRSCYKKRTYPGAYNCAPKSDFLAIIAANSNRSVEFSNLYALVQKYEAQLFIC